MSWALTRSGYRGLTSVGAGVERNLQGDRGDVTSIQMTGPELAVRTLARRLAPLGAGPARSAGHDRLALDWDGPGEGDAPLEVDLSWYGPAPIADRPGSEAVVQALSGLMQVHGRDAGGPRRIGLEVASVTAGVLAGHAAMAAMVGRSRGLPVGCVESSVLQAALLLVSHRVAADSSGSEWVPVPAGPAPGPPFRSAEGRYFEIETMDASVWKAFWERLGAGSADLALAWRQFRPRYFRGTCTLTAGLHEATVAHPLAEIAAVADACGVSLRVVRDYDEVLDESGASDGYPQIRPFPVSDRASSTATDAAAGALPLTGLRVIESTNRLQGPLAGLLLQMLGATVIRVEPPGGDLVRTVPPMLDGTGSFFLSFNRGKECVELNLRKSEERDSLVDLVADADVFLQNWGPDRAATWQLEATDLAAANPRLVYAHASGWGDRPELASILGTDFLVQADAGVAAGITPEGETPVPSRALLTDYAGALNTCEAVLAGLYQRERSGRGQHVHASLLDGAMSLQAHVFEAITTGAEKGRRRGRPVWGLLDRPLPTADGTLVVSVEDDDDVSRLCRACDVDPGDAGCGGIEGLLAERIADASSGSWEERLNAAGVACAEACTDLGALPADPRMAGLFEPLAGTASIPRPPWRLVS